MAFDTQITDLVGGTIDQVACDQWAADACKEIIHVLPLELKAKCSTVSTLNNSATTLDMDGIGDILHVTRLSADSGGYQVPCREIPAQYGGLAEDNTDLNYFATVNDPVYWVDSSSDVSTLKVKPTTTSAQTAIVHHITYPTVNVSDVSVIANFPDEAEYLVVLYTAVKQLHQYMNLKKSDLPSFVVPPRPTRTTQTGFSSYTSGLSETDPGIFSISAVAPAVPLVSTTSVSFSQTAPTFTKPVVAPDFAQVNTYIDTNEDIELASVKLQEISAQLNEYSANIQNEQVEFNKESVEYQAQLQISIQDAQFDNQEDARKLQKYQAEVSTYQTNINKEVQQYSTKLSQYQLELNTSYQAWAKTESDNISAYQADTATYQAEVTTKVQEFTQNLQKHSTDYQWYQGQYVALKADYEQGLQKLIGGGGAPPPAQ
jgi:hypothetical protein